MRHVLRRHLLRYAVIIAALLAGTAAVVPTVSAMEPLAGAGAPESDDAAIQDYWTPARMRGARPAENRRRDLPSSGEESPQAATPRAATRSLTSATTKADASSWSQGGLVSRTTGKVFFTLNGSDFVCSGSSVRSANRDTVLTAGHCVHSGPGAFASKWVFVPGYRGGERPYGTWTARKLFAPAAWTERGDIDHDIGFAVLGVQNGKHLADVVGAQPIAFNAARGQAVFSFGYPALGRYDGYRLVFCQGKPQADRFGSRDQGLRCDMTDGASGGPWFSSFNPATGTGTVTSVNSFGYDGMPDTMWGPTMDASVRSVFAKAQRA